MNVFYLDEDPNLAAKYHCNVHLNKMISETCQLLATVHRLHFGAKQQVYYNGRLKTYYILPEDKLNDDMTHKPILIEPFIFLESHVHHPCVQAMIINQPYHSYVLRLLLALHDEWFKLKGTMHKSFVKHKKLDITWRPWTGDTIAVPKAINNYVYRCEADPVVAYRKYYCNKLYEWYHYGTPRQRKLAETAYDGRPVPWWMSNDKQFKYLGISINN